MRVAMDGIVYGNNFSGGIARYWTEVLRAIIRLELPIHLDLVVPPAAHWPEGLPCRTSGRLLTSLAVARSDVFHTSYYTRWPRLKCPSVVTAYDFIDASFPLLHPNGEEFVEWQFDAIRKASAVITISKTTRDLAMELSGIDPARVFVAYPAVAEPFSMLLPEEEEIRRFRKEQTGGAPYLVHIGNRRNYKNFRTILKAFCQAAPSMDRHLLILGGRQPLAEDETHWVFSARLQDRIHFQPWVDDAMLRHAYAGADALVSASLMEGFGIPVIEALACGTGLILSDIPVYREIAEGHATFIEAANVEAWEQAMKEEIHVHPSWRDEVLNQYTWEATARVHMEAYKSVLK